MKKVISLNHILILFFILIVASCSNPPTEEMDAAVAAVELAEADSDANAYAATTLAASRALLTQMQAEADEKKYDLARELALEATGEAENAMRIGATAKKRASDDAEAAISAAKTMFAEANQTLIAARNVQRIVLDFADVQAEMSSISASILDAETDFASENYANAQTKAQEARSSVAEIQKRIADATQVATREK